MGKTIEVASLRWGLAFLIVVVASAGPAVADLLVLHDGTRVRTRGPWQEKGRLVVFTSEAGKLSSLRAQDIDLEASRRTTDAEKAAAERTAETEAEPEPRREPVLVLRDGDLPRASKDSLSRAAADLKRRKPVLFTTSWCGYCRKARAVLADLGLSYDERDIEKDAAAGAEFRRRFGDAGVPILVLGEDVVRGFNERTMRRAVTAFQEAGSAK